MAASAPLASLRPRTLLPVRLLTTSANSLPSRSALTLCTSLSPVTCRIHPVNTAAEVRWRDASILPRLPRIEMDPNLAEEEKQKRMTKVSFGNP